MKRYVLATLLAGFGTSYGMEKEASKTNYVDKLKSLVAGLTGYSIENECVEDARQLSRVHGLYFNLVPKDILGIVQYYRLAELLDREIEKVLDNKYEEALKNIGHLAQAAEYVHLFNNPKFIDGVINRINSRFGQIPEDVGRGINTLGAQLWLTHIRTDQLKLLEAAWAGDLVKVQQLIAQGVNVNARYKDGDTPLIRTAFNGHTEVVKELIKAAANLNAQTDDGRTALMWAAINGHTALMKILIDAGADVNARSNTGRTALMCAAEMERAEVVKVLIGSGADVNARNKRGATALDLAQE